MEARSLEAQSDPATLAPDVERSTASRATSRKRRARAGGDAAALRALPRRRGAPDHRGLPGRGEDDAREGARALARPRLLASAVHARPAALRRDRRQRLQPARRTSSSSARAGVRERPARRRDQPRLAEDAVGAARGDAGEPGDDRRRHATRSTALHGASRPRTRSSTRAPTRCPRRSSTASRCASRSATRRSPRRRGCWPSRRPTPPLDALEPVAGPEELRQAIDDATGDLRRGEPQPLRRRAAAAHALEPAPGAGRQPAGRASRCCASRRRARSPRAATTCSRTTSRPSRRRCSRTADPRARGALGRPDGAARSCRRRSSRRRFPSSR